MINKKFDAKSFLGLKTLSPLEERGIKGGLDNVVTVTVRETVKETSLRSPAFGNTIIVSDSKIRVTRVFILLL